MSVRSLASPRVQHALVIAGFYMALGGAMHGGPAMCSQFSPDAFTDVAARRFAEAVVAGDTRTALLAGQAAPGGVNAVGRDGETALLLAVDRLDEPMVAALLRAGANPNGGPDRAPLHEAVKAYDFSILRRLLGAGADPNGRLGGEPALYEAALIGATEAARLLLDAGARVDGPNSIGRTPAMVAAAADHWRMVGFLVDRGASIWVAVGAGSTIASFAARSALRPDSEEGQACAAVVTRLRSAGYPWPPPSPTEIRALRDSGKWPPTQARLQ